MHHTSHTLRKCAYGHCWATQLYLVGRKLGFDLLDNAVPLDAGEFLSGAQNMAVQHWEVQLTHAFLSRVHISFCCLVCLGLVPAAISDSRASRLAPLQSMAQESCLLYSGHSKELVGMMQCRPVWSHLSGKRANLCRSQPGIPAGKRHRYIGHVASTYRSSTNAQLDTEMEQSSMFSVELHLERGVHLPTALHARRSMYSGPYKTLKVCLSRCGMAFSSGNESRMLSAVCGATKVRVAFHQVGLNTC